MPSPFVNSFFGDVLTSIITLDPPYFTHTTALTQQLPILNSLTSNIHHGSSCSSSRQIQSAPLTFLIPSSLLLSSSDSSDSEQGTYIHAYIHQNSTNHHLIMSTLTAVEPTSTKAPILTEGDISPAIMMDSENAALNFFVSKSVPAEKQVTMIIPNMKDLRIHDWVSAECMHLVELPFSDFMKKMCTNYLHQDWEDQIRNQILTSTLTLSQTSFWNWLQKLLKLNCLL